MNPLRLRKRSLGFWLSAFSLLFVGLAHPRADDDAPTVTIERPGHAATRGQDTEEEANPYYDPVSAQGQAAQGLYVSGPFARQAGLDGIVRAARLARMDAVVIDVKDGQGRVGYDTQIEVLEESERGFLGDAQALVAGLKQEGIYTIARLTCFADPMLPSRRPDRAIVHQRTGNPWVSWGTGTTWLDPYNRDNHDMIVALAREVRDLGFDEIQLDYVRWPVDDGTQYASYPADDGRPRPQVLLDLLRRVDEAVDVPLGVDVFGLTAFRTGDSDGLGQDLETWVPHVEVFSPMLYMNAMRTWERGSPNRAFRLMAIGTGRLRERLGPTPVIRPWMQAFETGADEWSPEFIAEQVRGARVGGSDGFLFWHPGGRYGMLRRGMRAARSLMPFPLEERAAARARVASAAAGEQEELTRR